jgi:hypothetical protein
LTSVYGVIDGLADTVFYEICRAILEMHNKKGATPATPIIPSLT